MPSEADLTYGDGVWVGTLGGEVRVIRTCLYCGRTGTYLIRSNPHDCGPICRNVRECLEAGSVVKYL